MHGDVHRQNLVRVALARINHLDLAVSSSNKGRQPATWTVKVRPHPWFRQGAAGSANPAAGPQFVDLEFASVSFAVQDLSYAICSCGWGPSHGLWRRDNDKHREFLRAYLVASGQPADDDGVEELLADCFVRIIHTRSCLRVGLPTLRYLRNGRANRHTELSIIRAACPRGNCLGRTYQS